MNIERRTEIRIAIALILMFAVMIVHQLWCSARGTCLRPANIIFLVVTFHAIIGGSLVVMSKYRRVTLPRVTILLLATTVILVNCLVMRVPAVLRHITFSQFTVWFVLHMVLQFFVGLVVLPRLRSCESKDQVEI